MTCLNYKTLGSVLFFAALTASQTVGFAQESIKALDPVVQSVPAKTFAIASIIGDKVSVAIGQMQTGTMLDPNRKFSVNLPEQGLDGEIMLGVERVIKDQCTACKTVLLRVKAVETPDEGERMLPGLLGAAQQAKVDKLIVLTKYKDEARLTSATGAAIGQGKLTGIGFYIDTSKRTKNIDELHTGVGFLAPYAYFKLHVIDVTTGDLTYSRGLTTSKMIVLSQNAGFDLWEAIPTERKVPVLLKLVSEEVKRVLVPNVLGLTP